MHILLRQLSHLAGYKSPDTPPIAVVVLGGGAAAQATVESLAAQINLNYSLCLWEEPGPGTALRQAGQWKPAQGRQSAAAALADQLQDAEEEHILLTCSGVRFLRHALYCFAHEMEKQPAGALFADEFMGGTEAQQGASVLYPLSGDTFYASSPHLPQTTLWQKDVLLGFLQALEDQPLRPGALRGLLLRHALQKGAARHITQVLTEVPQALVAQSRRALALPPAKKEQPKADFLLWAQDPAYTKLAVHALSGAYPGSHIFLACLPDAQAAFSSLAGGNIHVLPHKNDPVAALDAAFAGGRGAALLVLKDLADLLLEDVFQNLLAGLAGQTIWAASPLVHLPEGTLLYAGAVAESTAQYLPLFAGRNLAEEAENGLVTQRREIGLLSRDCFAVKREAWQALRPDDLRLSTLAELAVELSLRVRAAGKHNLYCGDEALLMTREDADAANTATGSHTLHWLRQYPAALERDPFTQRDQTLHLNHIGYEVYRTLPGHLTGQGRRILAITHELSLTGAPVVLASALALLQEGGYDIVLVSPSDGPMRHNLQQQGISVLIDPAIAEREDWGDIAPGYDMALICTVVLFPLIKRLAGHTLPVLWWLHDADASFRVLQEVIPKELPPHIRIWCGGEYARTILHRYRPHFPAKVLLYGVEDRAGTPLKPYDISEYGDKLIFAFIGSIEERKGQDILAEAIGRLPGEVRSRCMFLFVGKVNDEMVFSPIRQVEVLYSENVRYLPGIPRDEIDSLYSQAHCLVCSSRDDPMPVYITEGMMFSRVVICSENTGTAALLQDGVNGFVYQNDDPAALAGKIEYVVRHYGALGELRRRGRAAYEAHFTMEGFRHNLAAAVEETMAAGKEVLP